MPKDTTVHKTDDVVVVVPAFNEGPVVKDTINNLSRNFRHIVCVDDGSHDDTKAQAMSTPATVLSHGINLGQGAALQTAIDYALTHQQFKYFVTFDADGQHRAADALNMLAIIRQNKADILLGSRFLGKTENISPTKKKLLKYAIKFSNRSTGVKLTDAHNGLRVLNRHAAEKLRLQTPDFSHATEIIERIAEHKLRYAEVPVTIAYTEYSRSKGQSMVNAVNIFFDVVSKKVIK